MSKYNYVDEADKLGYDFIDKIKNKGIYKCRVCLNEFEYQISAARNLLKMGFAVKCPVCSENSKRIKEQEANVEVIHNKGNGDYMFKSKSCGHTFPSTYGNLNSNRVCLKCRHIDLKSTATLNNLIQVGTNKYELPCGHVKIIKPDNLNKSQTCKVCYEQNLISSLASIDMIYVGKSVKGAHYRLCKFKDCGHDRDYQINDLNRHMKPVCKVCIAEKHKQEALDNGLEVVGDPTNLDPNYLNYKLSCCDKTTDLMITHVRRGSFRCPHCEETHLNNKSNLYILKMQADEFCWLKFGFSKNVEMRISCYGLADNVTVDILHVVPISTGRKALEIEKSIHSKLNIFRLPTDEMRKYFTVSGFSECYNTEHLETILLEIESKQTEGEICQM